MSLLNNLIDSFSIQNLQNFLRDKMPSFKPTKEDIDYLLKDKEFENYQSIIKIGEAILNNEDILVFASNTTEHLTERTGKKNQYEIAKRILKEDRKDAALFIFYDDKGDFRFSFVRANYLGTKRDFSDFKRYSYFVSPSLTNNTFIKQVGSCSFTSLDEIIKAFSVEPLNKLFYQDIAKSFYSLIGGSVLENKKIVERATTLIMPSNKTDNRKTLQEFGVRFIGRTIFCWFLKNKVSSNNKPLIPADWLSSVKVTETPDYYHTYLEKLFFEILNEKHSDRIAELPDGHQDIPFLNGGLFEPQADDYYVRGTLGISKYLNTLKVPNDWIALFFATLEQYNFTIDENSINDSEVSIDPEMLGTIFENLLAEIDPDTEKSARKSTGSFYTPREIVDYMVEQSLINYLKSKTNIDNDNQLQLLFKEASLQPETFTEPQRISLLNALSDVKILDPACGSGAFPMGCLHKIILALQKLDTDASWWKAKQISYQKNAMAKQFLKEKLDNSNSDYIRKLGVIQNSIYGVDIQPIAAEISKLRSFLSLVIDEKIIDDHIDGNRNIYALPNLEFKFVTANTLIGLEEENKAKAVAFDFGETETAIDELQDIRDSYLQTSGKDKEALKKQFEQKQNEIAKKEFGSGVTNAKTQQIISWKPFSNEGSKWFDPKWMFGVEKFDIVIGNPPYGISVKGDYRKTVLSQLPKVPDFEIYYFFIEIAKKFLKENGVKTYIIPNTFLFNVFASDYRKKLIENWELYLIDCTAFKIFDGATVYNAITIFNNTQGTKSIKYKVTSNADNFQKLIVNPDEILNKEKLLESNQNWSLAFKLSKKKLDLILKIKNNTVPLSTLFNDYSQGLIAYDSYQGQSKETIKNRIFHYTTFVKKDLKKWLWGGDVTRYSVTWNGKEWIDYCQGIANPRKAHFFNQERILIREITNPSIFCALTSEELYYDPAVITILKSDKYDIKVLLGILNSKLMTFLHFNSSPKATKGAFPKILVDDIKNFPIPVIEHKSKGKFISIVNEILDNKKENLDTSVLENEIDVMVYKLYELTYDEVLVIDAGFGLSAQEYENYSIK